MLANRKTIWILIMVAVVINSLGLWQPLLRNDDPVLYANIAKHIILNNDWLNLTAGGEPWLDKPHFPFWMSALSFKIFGISSFSYILPGFLFHILGLYYTYRLATSLYNRDIGLLAALIYSTSLHLLISAIDLRAEAYLLGEIMPACYYWLRYDRNGHIPSLLAASGFTALAMMTKGLFVVVTIFSGLLAAWVYRGEWRRVVSGKWLLAYVVTLIMISPELISLYLQFDCHPDLVVFGRTHVSGLAWYFWGSQFGRFFNSGPITNAHGNPFFFVHTLLWAFLPWSILFLVASWRQIRGFKLVNQVERAKFIYLAASFIITFIMFSATKFQLDHYTNIILPFAAILCANYLYHQLNLRRLAVVQQWLAGLILVLNLGLAFYFLSQHWSAYLLLVLIIGVGLYYWRYRHQLSYLEQVVCLPSLAICFTYGLLLAINYWVYAPYDVGYQTARLINQQSPAAVYDLDHSWLPVEFHLQRPYTQLKTPAQLPAHGKYYLIVAAKNWQTNQYQLDRSQYREIGQVCGNTIDRILPYVHDSELLKQKMQCLEVIYHD